jgi:2-phosphosulfolactate phosphatase
MDIRMGSLLEGPRQAKGVVAIIDVFRAFTTAAVALANGASRIVMVGSIQQALALRASGAGQVCMGEVSGRAPDGFDFGNSPFEVSKVDFRGKTIIQRTSAGTQGIVAAGQAERLYAGVTGDRERDGPGVGLRGFRSDRTDRDGQQRHRTHRRG